MVQKKRKRLRNTLIICASVLVLAILSGGLYVNGMLNKINYASGKVDIASSVSGVLSDDDLTTSGDSPQSKIDSLNSQIASNVNDQNASLMSSDKVFNILLIGNDTRTGTGPSPSDTMILLSINKSTKTIILTSFLRDIYCAIPGEGNNRLNAAYAYGGADLLIQTIQNNFKIRIDRYASVDFMSFIDIIDQLGGVTITVTSAELPILNSYVKNINSLKGLPADDGLLPAAGTNLQLTGKQALSYARIRYVGTDFERTQRQRTILTQIFAKVKKLNLVEQNKLLNTLLPDITTNLTKGELISLALDGTHFSSFTVEQDTIPIDGSYKNLVIRSMDVLGLDFSANIKQLQQTIYGGT